MFNIGTHYFSGKGVDLDMQKASEFFRKAADLGFGLAQVGLSALFASNQPVYIRPNFKVCCTYINH